MPIAEKLEYTKTHINRLKTLTGETILSSVVDNVEQKYSEYEELKTENELLNEQIPTGQANGEQIHLTDSSNLPLKDIEISGNSYQEITEAMPSPEYPSEIKSCKDNINFTICNKNLFKPIEFLNENDAFISGFEVFARNGIYGINGEVSAVASQQASWRLTTSYKSANYQTYINNTDVDFFLKAGTYTISIVFLGGTFENSADKITFSYRLDNESQTDWAHTHTVGQINSSTQIGATIQHTFTVSDETPFSLIADIVRKQDTTYNNVQWIIQLEEGETATEYEKHQEQNFTIPIQKPFREVEGTKDTFVKENGKWFEKHLIKRKVFDGTEDVVGYNTANVDKTVAFQIKLNDSITMTYETKQIITNMFSFNSTWGSDIECYNNANQNFIIRIKVDRLTDEVNVANFRKWLAERYEAGEPVYVDYILETPELIECTEEQIEVLEEIQKSKTYKNETHIYSTDEISPNFNITYKKDLETILNNLTTAIIAEGGVN